MTHKQRSPRKAGIGHKLAGCVLRSFSAAWPWALILLPLLVGLLAWSATR